MQCSRTIIYVQTVSTNNSLVSTSEYCSQFIKFSSVYTSRIPEGSIISLKNMIDGQKQEQRQLPYYRTNVSVDRAVWHRLKQNGTAGDILNDVIRALLDEKEGKAKRKTSESHNRSPTKSSDYHRNGGCRSSTNITKAALLIKYRVPNEPGVAY
jgi:hypothetical protein